LLHHYSIVLSVLENDSKIQELERSQDMLQNDRDRLSAELKAVQAQLTTASRERDALKSELELVLYS